MKRVFFCPRPLMMAAAFISLLGLCAVQVVAQASRTSGSHGTSPAVVVAAQPTVRRSEGGAFFRGAGQKRSLADEGCSGDEEGSLFVDSLITNLKNPIGGCYKTSSFSNSSTSEHSSYALGGGGPTKGQSWIYATTAGAWVIGVVEETDEVTGEVSSLTTVCSSIINQADQLSGPTDSQLTGVWRCSYFEAGMTNYAQADFEGVECGCAGRTISSQSSGSGEYSSTAIAIATLASLAALSIIVCLCLLHLKKRKPIAQDPDSAAKEDALASKEEALEPNEDPLASKEEALATKEDSLASKEEALAPNEDPLASKEEALATKEDSLASNEDALAPKGDALASEEDALASEEDTLAV